MWSKSILLKDFATSFSTFVSSNSTLPDNLPDWLLRDFESCLLSTRCQLVIRFLCIRLLLHMSQHQPYPAIQKLDYRHILQQQRHTLKLFSLYVFIILLFHFPVQVQITDSPQFLLPIPFQRFCLCNSHIYLLITLCR